MRVFIARIVWRVQHVFKVSLRDRVKLFLKITGNELHELVEVEPAPETWGEYYIRLYGEIPDYAKHRGNGYWVDLNKIRPVYYIARVIKKEEEKYQKMLKRNSRLIKKKYSDISKLDGKILSYLHHTHGCDPILLEGFLDQDLPQALHDAYLEEYAIHKQTGGKK